MTRQDHNGSVYVGIDWGSQTHQVCVLDGNRTVLLDAAFAHSGAGVGELVEAVLRAANDQPTRVIVATEQPRGAVVETSQNANVV